MSKAISIKRAKKADRERQVLLALVEMYIREGEPIGSNTLKENGLSDISSATIRNYFAKLEGEGYLMQQHTSGGRIPTDKAFELYAEEHVGKGSVEEGIEARLGRLSEPVKEVTTYLQGAAETLSELSGYAVFLSMPRFDHDFVLEMKLVPLGSDRLLCVMLTDFGSILTEVISIEEKLSSFSIKRIEEYLGHKLTGAEQPELGAEEEALASRLYTELMVRYITRYASFTDEEVSRCGFSRLLAFPEFQSPTALAKGLSLFESSARMRKLLREAQKDGVKYWVGVPEASQCSVIAMPYRVHETCVGAIGILGPTRLDYREAFGILGVAAELISEGLTKSLYKFKIQYRQPETLKLR